MKNLGTFGGNSYARAINKAGRVTGYSYLYDYSPTDGPWLAFLYYRGTMEDLGSIGGASRGWAINDRGQVVGTTLTLAIGNLDHAMLYYRGTMKDLGTLGGYASYALDINNRGQIVGDSEMAEGQNHAFIYSGGTMRDLNDLLVPGSFDGVISSANAINDRGRIAATALIDGNPRAVLLVPVRKSHGKHPAVGDTVTRDRAQETE